MMAEIKSDFAVNKYRERRIINFAGNEFTKKRDIPRVPRIS